MSTVPGDTHTVQVMTFNSEQSPFSVTLPHPCLYKQAMEALVKKLGLKPASLEVFGLFTGGKLGAPNKILMEGDNVPSGGEVFLQRWCFNIDRELKAIKSDDVAINLLYCEAKQRLEEGTIFPSPEEAHELESLSDPFFPTEKQYLDLIRIVEGYCCFKAPTCCVQDKDIKCNSCTIEMGRQVTCLLDVNHLTLKTKPSSADVLVQWPWTAVKRWKLNPSDGLIKFEVCLQQENASILIWICFKTPQAHVLFHAASMICDLIVADPVPKAKSRLVGKGYDPLHEFINEKLFGGPAFSSLASKRIV